MNQNKKEGPKATKGAWSNATKGDLLAAQSTQFPEKVMTG
jgi:hypothetical protein